MMIKKIFYFLGLFVFILSIFSPAAAAISAPGVGQGGDSSPDWPEDTHLFFLPIVTKITGYTLSGQVKDAEDLPLGGATVQIEGGRQAQTDANGVFSMIVPEGSRTIVASKAGYNFHPATADLEVTGNMNNLNFSAESASAPSVLSCTNLLLNSDFVSADANWTIRPANNPSTTTNTHWFSPALSMLSGVPVGTANPFPDQWTTGEFYQATTVAIPANATVVQLRMRLLPRSSDPWGYHIAEQAMMDASVEKGVPDVAENTNAPFATEAQYGFVCTDGSDTDTCNPDNGGKMLFKWFPIDSWWWLFRSYDMRQFRGETVSVLFGASNDGDNFNTALYVDDVYMYYCTP